MGGLLLWLRRRPTREMFLLRALVDYWRYIPAIFVRCMSHQSEGLLGPMERWPLYSMRLNRISFAARIMTLRLQMSLPSGDTLARLGTSYSLACDLATGRGKSSPRRRGQFRS